MFTGKKVSVGRITKLLILLLIGSFVSGCPSDRYITLRYPPESERDELSIRDSTLSQSGHNTEKTIALFKFSYLNLSPDISRVGYVICLADNVCAAINSENDVSEWFTNAITMELGHAGYKVLKGEELKNTKNIPVLNGKFKLQVQKNPGLNAVVVIATELELDNMIIIKEQYRGSSIRKQGMFTGPSDDRLAEGLSLALADALRQMINDIDAQLFLMSNP